jgi:hypothetical protein
MTELVEFKVTKTLFDEVKADPEFRIGFEAEFHVRWASDLLRDDNNELPPNFNTFAVYPAKNELSISGGKIYGGLDDMYHEQHALVQLCRIFEHYLGLGKDQIGLDTGDYTRWTLVVDPSLYDKPKLLSNPNDDMGVELISPIMPLRDGLAWMAKICEMITKFEDQGIDLYTTALCSLHVNLSHSNMKNFDYAKLAVLSGDQHYLQDFHRVNNQYTVPILQKAYSVLAKTKAGEVVNQQATSLLNLRGWTPERVMTDLASLIPMQHWMSIDFHRIHSDNPYVEFRIAGNAGYEKRFDEIASMAIRFASLIKIACDPNAYRTEYLKKIYQLVSSVGGSGSVPDRASANPFPKIRIYFTPIMNVTTRHALDTIESFWSKQTLTVTNGSYLFLSIMKSAIDQRQIQTQRIRQGLQALLGVLKIDTSVLVKSLRNNAMLNKYGIIRPNEKPLSVITAMTNAINGLGKPLSRSRMMTDALEQDRQREAQSLLELHQRRKRRMREHLRQKEAAIRPL